MSSKGLINFQSERDINSRRERKREAQRYILEKAKQKYEREEKKREKQRQRGDDTWMLPSVSEALKHEDSHKKQKKSKKEKKSKRKKKHKESKRRPSSSEDEDSEEGEEWVEAESTAPVQKEVEMETEESKVIKGPQLPPSMNEANLQRDDWMSSPFLSATYSQSDIKKKREEERQKEKEKEGKLNSIDNPGRSARELNPYWKNGGTGLPEEKPEAVNPASSKSSVGIGDRGISWLRKSYQRAVEQAKEEGKSLEEIARERWGSLEKVHQMLAEAEGFRRSLTDSRNDRQKWRKPQDNSDRYTSRDRYDNHESGDRSYSDREKSHSSRDRSHDSRTSSHDYRDRSPNSRERSHYSRDRSVEFRNRSHDSKNRSYDNSPDRTHSRDRRREEGHGRGGENRYSRERSHAKLEEKLKPRFQRPSEDNDSFESSSEKLSKGSLGSLKGLFRKPGDDDDSSVSNPARERSDASGGGWRKKGFEKPQETLRKEYAHSKDSHPREESSKGSREERQRSRSESEFSDSSSERDSDRDEKKMSSSSESEEGEGSDTDQEEQVEVLTEEEMNQLGAKIIKAEMFGNAQLASELKAKLESARKAAASQLKKKPETSLPGKRKKEEKANSSDEEVILTRTNRMGQSFPVKEVGDDGHHGKKRRKKKGVETHSKEGHRQRYFADDDDMDLKTMVQREKMSLAEDQTKMFAKASSRAMKALNADYDLDDMFVSTANKVSDKEEAKRDRDRAIREHQKMEAALSKCPYCIDSPEMQKHLIVALGIKTYLCLPKNQSLTEGHCLIVPMHHSMASTAVDEDVWAEIQIFRKGLTKMFQKQDQDAVFMEYASHPRKQRHMRIECIPLPKETGDMAPIYFKKALQESETEWSQNKKVVDTRQKGIRASIPKGFPYFSVDFGLDGGFAHVVEDEQLFPHYFGKEVIGGMIDVEPRRWRNPYKEDFDAQRKKVLQFSEWWKPFDWTTQIDRDNS